MITLVVIAVLAVASGVAGNMLATALQIRFPALGRPSRRMIVVFGCMALVGAVATTVVALPDEGPDDAAGDCAALDSNAEVTSVRGDDESRLADVTYLLDDETNDPDIDIAGRLVGDLPSDQGLYIAKSGDPSTHDSTPEQNPASAYYFLRDELRLGSGGCWQEDRWQLGYPCVAGVTFRFQFMIIPTATAHDLLARREANPDGFHPRVFEEDPEIVQLGHIDVPTDRHPDCPA